MKRRQERVLCFMGPAAAFPSIPSVTFIQKRLKSSDTIRRFSPDARS